MSRWWFAVAVLGLAAFLSGLGLAAWRGQTRSGGWQAGAWRWLVLAAAGWVLFALGLRWCGTERIGIEYPPVVGGP